MKDARTRKASNYFDKENQGILRPIRDSDELTIRITHSILLNILETKMEELSRRGSMFLTHQGGRGSILMDASRRRTLSRQNEGLVNQN